MAAGLSLSAASAASEEAPEGIRIEAEDPAPRSGAKAVEMDEASGGKAMSSERAWEPLFMSEASGEGDEVTVHVRHRGGPINLKTGTVAEQTELGWVWDKPETLTWSSFGTFKRADLGEQLIIIRGEGGDAVVVDCVVLSGGGDAAPAAPDVPEEPQGSLPPEVPDADADAEPLRVSVMVDWEAPDGPAATAMHWALNDYSVKDPKKAAQPAFNEYVTEVAPAAVRIHHANLVNEWTDPKTRTWNAALMRECLDAAVGFGDAEVMFCINWWPEWLHAKEVLPSEKEAEFVRLCGELPGVLAEIGHPAASYEVTNELEGLYEKAGDLPRLWSLVERAAEALRAAAPDAAIGGPAMTWPKPSWLRSFLDHGVDHLDFVSWHNYGSGDASDPNEQVLGAAARLGGHARDAVAMLREADPEGRIKAYLTEFNVSWLWTTRDRRMGNSVGALFQAAVIGEMIQAGVDGAFVWHVQDNIYGLLGSDGERRGPAPLFVWGNRHLVGTTVPVLTNHPDAVGGIAVRHDDGGRALLLLVKAGRAIEVSANATLTAGGDPWKTVDFILPPGLEARDRDPADGLRVPGYTLVLLSTKPAAAVATASR